MLATQLMIKYITIHVGGGGDKPEGGYVLFSDRIEISLLDGPLPFWHQPRSFCPLTIDNMRIPMISSQD